MLFKTLVSGAAFGALVSGNPIDAAKPPAAQTVVQFPTMTWLEGIVVRSNGDLISTTLFDNAPIIYTVRQPASPNQKVAEILATVPGVQSLLGIVEVPNPGGEETYFTVGGNFTAWGSILAIPGSFKAFKITISSAGKVNVQRVSNLTPTTVFPNGVADIPGSPGSVLIAESTLGIVGRLDLSTGQYDDTAFAFPEMLAPNGSALPIGVAAVAVRGSYLYFGVTATASIFRVAVDSKGYLRNGATPELVADISAVAPGIDDWTLDAEGNILLATNAPENAVVFVNVATGESKVLIGGPTDQTVRDSTSLAFGRTALDSHIIYVNCGVNFSDPSSGGKIVAVDTRLLNCE
jgi:hypothetical protein